MTLHFFSSSLTKRQAITFAYIKYMYNLKIKPKNNNYNSMYKSSQEI